ncbi:MAG: hypothetical protein FJ405_12530, partial [Verrucomicrobia bacterium]|nr:hypothetical protein [Verrucomicrobiota bacterium]
MASFVGGTSFVTKGLELAFPGRRRPRVPSQVTALDLDGTMLRVVHAAPRGNRIEVVRIEAVRLDLASDADRSDPAIIGKAVARALQSLGLTAASVVMGIPRAQVILRTLLLPSIQDIRELASMVHLQIGRELPFRMEDAVIDFKVRRQVGGGGLRTEGALAGAGGDAPEDQAPPPKLEVLVAAVKREAVDFFVQISEEAGLNLSALGLLPYANARCVEACQVADGGQAFALVSLRPDEVTIDVISEESLLFSRGASIRPATEVTAPPDVPGDTPQQEG